MSRIDMFKKGENMKYIVRIVELNLLFVIKKGGV